MIERISPEPLETKRLLIRPFEEADADEAYAALSGTGGYDGDLAPFATLKSTRENLSAWSKGYKNATCYTYAVVFGGRIIGLVDLHGFIDANGVCSLGYLLAENMRGSGYASEAVRAVVKFAFDKLKVDMITLYINPNNLNSVRVAAAIGARKLDQINGQDFYILIPSMFRRNRR